MIENKYPIFGNGQVINKEALDLLRDNPAELTDLLYLDKKDGIISGFDLITDLDDKKVTVTRGIIKYNEKIFWMNEDYKFNMPEIENRYILKLKLFSDFEERKFYIRSADFSLEILDIGASNSENTEIENKILNGLEIQEENNNQVDDYDLMVLERVYDEVINKGNEGYLYNFSSDELAIIRNTLYARKGYKFKKKKYQNYFGAKSWYNPTTNSQNILTKKEEKLANIIKRYE